MEPSTVLTKVVKLLPNTSGLMDQVSSSDQNAELLMLKFLNFLTFPNGTMMDLHATRPKPKIQKSSSSPLLTIVTPSDKETTSWLCAKLSNGLITLSRLFILPTLISVTSALLSGMHAKKNYLGTVLNKSTPCSEPQQNSLAGLSDGPTMDTQVLRDLTIAQLVPMFASAESLLMPITKLAYMQELTFQEQMLKLCQDSMNINVDPASELKLVTTFTCPATF